MVETVASRHLCTTRDLFKEFEAVIEGEQVYMGNSSVSDVRDSGKVEIKLSSGKTLFLQNVLYVSSLRGNMISRALLIKLGVKLVFESDFLIMTL